MCPLHMRLKNAHTIFDASEQMYGAHDDMRSRNLFDAAAAFAKMWTEIIIKYDPISCDELSHKVIMKRRNKTSKTTAATEDTRRKPS